MQLKRVIAATVRTTGELCSVISGIGRKFRFEDFGQNTTDIRCRQNAGKFFMMKNDR
jgi:hypothetical protein